MVTGIFLFFVLNALTSFCAPSKDAKGWLIVPILLSSPIGETYRYL